MGACHTFRRHEAIDLCLNFKFKKIVNGDMEIFLAMLVVHSPSMTLFLF